MRAQSGIMRPRNNYLLTTCVGILLVLGIVMLFSTSAYAQDAHGDIYYFLKRQLVWLLLGAAAAGVAAHVDYRLWRRLCWPAYGVTVVLLVLCFVPGVGSRLNGSWRWVHFGPVTFQPSELAKLASVLVMAHWYATYEEQSGKFLRGFLFPGLLAAIPTLLILKEEDMGTALLVGLVAVAVMFVAGGNLFYILGSVLLLGGAVYLLAIFNPNRLGRMTAFLDLEKHKEGFGLQQWEALKAFAAGGLQGVGLGDSREKMRYLPYAHTDFILPIIGEELGLLATLLIVFAFLCIAMCGLNIAKSARERFGMLLAFGMTLTITLQAVVNIGVTTALLPNKGMPLPFISAGGSNLCICLLFIGILTNVSRHANDGPVSRRARPLLAGPAVAVAHSRLRKKRTPARRLSADV